MFTSVKKFLRTEIFKGYAAASAFCILFGTVYECFSHGVYTAYMLCAFLFPFLGGCVLLGAFYVFCGKIPKCSAQTIYALGIATLTVGSFIKGVLYIYGTTNRLCAVYTYAGAAMAVLGFCGLIYKIKTNNS